MVLALAVDLGGTKVESALVDENGLVRAGSRFRAPTSAAASRSEVIAAVEDVVRRTVATAAAEPVAAAGIGSAGPIDLPSGTVSPLNLPRLAGFGLVDTVRAASGIDQVSLRLDGTCIALAETWRGAAQGVANAIVFVVSTGVGGGIVSDGRVVSGRTGNAGHLGQIVIDRVDGTLSAATVEGIGSGTHTVAWAIAQAWQGATGEDLAASAKNADPLARAAIVRSATAVGVGIANAAILLDLEIAVIGGGFAAVSDDYDRLVEASARRHALNAYAQNVRVVRAALGGDAPLIGAAALVHRPDLLGWRGAPRRRQPIGAGASGVGG